MKRRAVGRTASLTARMAIVFVLVVALYAAIAAGVVAIALIGPGWAIGATVVTVAVLASATTYARGNGFFLRALGLRTQPAGRELQERVARLAALAEVPTPTVLLVESEEANAFTVGIRRKSVSLVVTTALRHALDSDELDAVLAHELSHIVNHDAALMTIAAMPRTVGHVLIGGSGDSDVLILFFFVVWPLGLPLLGLGTLLTLAFSRTREFAADRGSALITGRPEDLMSALTKLAGPHARPEGDLRAVEAFCIAPTSISRFAFLMDHPPLEKRLAALAQICREMGRPVS